MSDKNFARILTLTSRAPQPIYAPSDDSLLMVKVINEISVEGKRVLDLGTGSGILGLLCAMRGGQVTAADVNPSAISFVEKTARTLGVQLKPVISNLFSEIQGRFDLILFNPPYLPSQKIEDAGVDAGANGRQMIDGFLDCLPRYLDKDAEALLLLSSLNNPGAVVSQYRQMEFSTVATRSLFFEQLQVLRVCLRDNFAI